jgi:hypothetical protein
LRQKLLPSSPEGALLEGSGPQVLFQDTLQVELRRTLLEGKKFLVLKDRRADP